MATVARSGGLRAEVLDLLKEYAKRESHADASHVLREYGLAQTLSNVTPDNLLELRVELKKRLLPE